MLGLKDALLVKANVGRTVLMNAQDHVEVLVKEDVKEDVLVAGISVPLDVLNHALLAAMDNVQENVVGTARIIVAVAAEIVAVVVAEIIVIVRLTTMIKKTSPDS